MKTIFVSLGLFAAGAQADILYVIPTATQQLYRVNTSTGTALALATTQQQLTSLAAVGPDLYALDVDQPGVVLSINPNSGAGAPTAAILDPDTIAIAFRPFNDRFYSITEGQFGDAPLISTFEVDTGDISPVFFLNDFGKVPQFMGVKNLVFDAAGTLYVSVELLLAPGQISRGLWSVDLQFGDVSYVCDIALNSPKFGDNQMHGMATSSDGGLWGSLEYELFPAIPLGSFDPEKFSIFNLATFDPVIIDGIRTTIDTMTLTSESCLADVNGDGALDILDFVAFQSLFQSQNPGADCNADGAFSILDFVCFQQLFQAGCD